MNISSPRLGFILATILTLILLVGSTILQQVVFKAEQNFASLSLTPSNLQASKGSSIEINLQSNAAGPLYLTGVQATIEFDASKLKLLTALPPNGWRTLKLDVGANKLTWLFAPDVLTAIPYTIWGESRLGSLKFDVINTGQVSLNFVREETILAGTDPAQGNLIYNAIESVQNSVISVNSSVESEVIFPEATDLNLSIAPDLEPNNSLTSQRITSSYVAPAVNDALVFVGLAFSGKASVEFGQSDKLGNLVEGSKSKSSHVLILGNLAPNTRYFYRIIGEDVENQAKFTSSIKSFKTRDRGEGEVSASQSDVLISPARTSEGSILYILPRNEQGDLIVSLPQVSVQGEATLGVVRQVGDYYQVSVVPKTGKKELVKLVATVDNVEIGSKSLVLDPNYVEPVRRISSTDLVLDWNDRASVTLFIGAILLFLLGFIFIKLIRSY